jgi:DNA invertase Pin-like site-specific DNA recombinase
LHRSGSTWTRSLAPPPTGPAYGAALEYARDGDVIVVHTLDRLGRTVRDTLNLIHELDEGGVGIRNLADPIKVDSSNPADPMAQLAVVLLAQMERTYTLERAAHARAVATAKGRRIGRPVRTRRTCATPATLSPRSSPSPGSLGPAGEVAHNTFGTEGACIEV